MSTLSVEGSTPLIGNISLSGSKISALKLIHASMFSNEDVTLENVPKLDNILSDLEVIKSIGGQAEWIGNNKLLLNGSGLNSYEIPYELGSKYKTSILLAAPLIFRFGKAIVPKPTNRPINRWVESWQSFNMNVKEDARFIYLEADQVSGSVINFKTNTHMGTDNAILTALFANGETIISNAAEEVEVDDLIAFCNLIGGSIERTEPRKIKVEGKRLFKGGTFKVQNDKEEAVAFATAAIATDGNVSIKGVDRISISSFINMLTKLGCKFEFSKDELVVWHANEEILPVEINSSPAPGFLVSWLPYAVMLLNKAQGESIVHDTVYVNRFDYTKELNMMGANIELCKPSEVGLTPVISDDLYDFVQKGEPTTVAKIYGTSKLRGSRLNIVDLKYGPILLLAALAAEGRSEIGNYEILDNYSENFIQKLEKLGARFSIN